MSIAMIVIAVLMAVALLVSSGRQKASRARHRHAESGDLSSSSPAIPNATWSMGTGFGGRLGAYLWFVLSVVAGVALMLVSCLVISCSALAIYSPPERAAGSLSGFSEFARMTISGNRPGFLGMLAPSAVIAGLIGLHVPITMRLASGIVFVAKAYLALAAFLLFMLFMRVTEDESFSWAAERSKIDPWPALILGLILIFLLYLSYGAVGRSLSRLSQALPPVDTESGTRADSAEERLPVENVVAGHGKICVKCGREADFTRELGVSTAGFGSSTEPDSTTTERIQWFPFGFCCRCVRRKIWLSDLPRGLCFLLVAALVTALLIFADLGARRENLIVGVGFAAFFWLGAVLAGYLFVRNVLEPRTVVNEPLVKWFVSDIVRYCTKTYGVNAGIVSCRPWTT